jgi:hypothetical protein
MAATKQTYTASPTWTAAGVATLFEDAFIDAGLMTTWHDSFANGALEHRVLEIEYDSTKAYGTCYYWFIFATTGVFISVAGGWNTGTNKPSGTQYLDYYQDRTNTTADHRRLGDATITSTALELNRYTSGDYSWFVIRNGSTPTPFFIAPSSVTLPAWLDLDKILFHHFIQSNAQVTSATLGSARGYVEFISVHMLRRSFASAGAIRGTTTQDGFRRFVPTMVYGALGNQNSNSTNAATFTSTTLSTTSPDLSGLIVPYGFSNTNSEYATDYHPIVNGYTYSLYTNDSMPSDFGLAFDYSGTSFSFGDQVVISATTEEWEVLQFANNTSTESPTALLLARVV